MIKWLSGSRLKTATENEPPSPLTNDPLAAITRIATHDGVYQTYAVSRVNPLFIEEIEARGEESKTSPNVSPDIGSDQRSSPRKSISSGYESRCNSSSDSSSCTECEENQTTKSLNEIKREKRLTKQSKTEKKKRADCEKWAVGLKGNILNEDPFPSPTNISRKSRKYKNGSPSGSSNLSPIPEGKVDCSIPPPIWPRFEENFTENKEGRLNSQVPGSIFHNGTTNPLNFMFKYNEKYPICCKGAAKTFWNVSDETGHIYDDISVKTEYERNWTECCKSYRDRRNCENDGEDGRQSGDDSGKGFTPESTLERLSSAHQNELTQEVLRDLANLMSYALSKQNSVPLEIILKNLAESIQKCLEILSQTASEDSLRDLYDNLNRNTYINKVWNKLLNRYDDDHKPSITGDEDKNGVNTEELTRELQKLTKQTQRSSKLVGDLPVYELNNLKDDIYSSGSEGKNSSSSSSGCKDLYVSSNSSSSAGKDVFSAVSFESVRERDKPYVSSIRDLEKASEESTKKSTSDDKQQSDSELSLIHHQRESSSSSTESAFGFSDSSQTPSDSLFAEGVLNPVFLHENIYSVPKSMRNAIICDSFCRTKDADCGSVRNCGSSAFEKLISAKRKTSSDLGPLATAEYGKTQFSTIASANVENTILKKIEHPYYVAMGRPDFTLDLPQAEKLMKKIASSKRRRCWGRLTASILGLVFFLLSVMMVSLVITKGRRMFGAI